MAAFIEYWQNTQTNEVFVLLMSKLLGRWKPPWSEVGLLQPQLPSPCDQRKWVDIWQTQISVSRFTIDNHFAFTPQNIWKISLCQTWTILMPHSMHSRSKYLSNQQHQMHHQLELSNFLNVKQAIRNWMEDTGPYVMVDSPDQTNTACTGYV